MKLFALYSIEFLLSVGFILLLNNKSMLVNKLPVSNFKRKILLLVKEENAMYVILGACALEVLLTYISGLLIF